MWGGEYFGALRLRLRLVRRAYQVPNIGCDPRELHHSS